MYGFLVETFAVASEFPKLATNLDEDSYLGGQER